MRELLEALTATRSTLELDIEGRSVRLTSLDRIYWPDTGWTKRDMVRYYLEVADALLTHIKDRPLTLGRWPEGVDGPNWFQTNCPHPPAWMTTHPLVGGGRDYCVVEDLAGLLWAINLGSLELHPLLSKSATPGVADVVVFDLDPGPQVSLVDCCAVSLQLRGVLERSGLDAVAKTSGSLGLHVFVPLNGRIGFAETKPFARELARRLAAADPQRVTDLPQRGRRVGKVFIDWSQNDANKSIVAPYSLRAMPWPVSSAPVTWEEVEQVVATRSLEHLPLTADAALQRLRRKGDLFAPATQLQQSL